MRRAKCCDLSPLSHTSKNSNVSSHPSSPADDLIPRITTRICVKFTSSGEANPMHIKNEREPRPDDTKVWFPVASLTLGGVTQAEEPNQLLGRLPDPGTSVLQRVEIKLALGLEFRIHDAKYGDLVSYLRQTIREPLSPVHLDVSVSAASPWPSGMLSHEVRVPMAKRRHAIEKRSCEAIVVARFV